MAMFLATETSNLTATNFKLKFVRFMISSVQI